MEKLPVQDVLKGGKKTCEKDKVGEKYCLTFPADTDPVDSCFALGGEYIHIRIWVEQIFL